MYRLVYRNKNGINRVSYFDSAVALLDSIQILERNGRDYAAFLRVKENSYIRIDF